MGFRGICGVCFRFVCGTRLIQTHRLIQPRRRTECDLTQLVAHHRSSSSSLSFTLSTQISQIHPTQTRSSYQSHSSMHPNITQITTLSYVCTLFLITSVALPIGLMIIYPGNRVVWGLVVLNHATVVPGVILLIT